MTSLLGGRGDVAQKVTNREGGRGGASRKVHIGPDIRLSESGKKIGVIGLKCLG